MIKVVKLNGEEFAINSNHIETISENPDTTIKLTNGNLYIVKNSMDDLINKIIEFNRQTHITFE